MGKSEKQMYKEQGRNQRIIDTAFRLFVEKKIEAVSMDEIKSRVKELPIEIQEKIKA